MQIICKVTAVYPSIEKEITTRSGKEMLTIKPMMLKSGGDTIYCEALGQEARRLDQTQLDGENTYVATLRSEATEWKSERAIMLLM